MLAFVGTSALNLKNLKNQALGVQEYLFLGPLGKQNLLWAASPILAQACHFSPFDLSLVPIIFLEFSLVLYYIKLTSASSHDGVNKD